MLLPKPWQPCNLTMFKVNDRYFHNLYDASKYVMKLAAQGKKVEIREAAPAEELISRLRSD